ncbi:hypothetical protein RUMCAL_01844 [Ruminococcus callidus ATCC 27760]|uniref:Uncharacterized protein n=1 Tax=Ruminococcus callidus ATCC 27760 TaxID=411473 RepID=U2KRH3_9FIRM|nr:hypothetical protein RUMCAL_01844 [Ruminococcus callidus ATCC 27760]
MWDMIKKRKGLPRGFPHGSRFLFWYENIHQNSSLRISSNVGVCFPHF